MGHSRQLPRRDFGWKGANGDAGPSQPHVDVDGDFRWLRCWPLARASFPKIELGGNSEAQPWLASASASASAAHNLRKLPTARCHIFHWQRCRWVSWLALYLRLPLRLRPGWLPQCSRGVPGTGAKQAGPGTTFITAAVVLVHVLVPTARTAQIISELHESLSRSLPAPAPAPAPVPAGAMRSSLAGHKLRP